MNTGSGTGCCTGSCAGSCTSSPSDGTLHGRAAFWASVRAACAIGGRYGRLLPGRDGWWGTRIARPCTSLQRAPGAGSQHLHKLRRIQHCRIERQAANTKQACTPRERDLCHEVPVTVPELGVAGIFRRTCWSTKCPNCHAAASAILAGDPLPIVLHTMHVRTWYSHPTHTCDGQRGHTHTHSRTRTHRGHGTQAGGSTWMPAPAVAWLSRCRIQRSHTHTQK